MYLFVYLFIYVFIFLFTYSIFIYRWYTKLAEANKFQQQKILNYTNTIN